jgi:insertion element IS1 protein InsB
MTCKSCGSENVKLNGHIHNGKQNHLCRDCGRQFVLAPTQKRITDAEKATVDKLLLERISLAGISRVVGVSEVWLQSYIKGLYEKVPDDLGAVLPKETDFASHLVDKFDALAEKKAAIKKKVETLPEDWDDVEDFDPIISCNEFEINNIECPLMESLYEKKDGILFEVTRCEADEMWTFVEKKENKQWLWLVMNTMNRQIVALHVGGRGQDDAKILFDKVPQVFKDNTVFFTDFWNGYHILEEEKHLAAGKEKGYTNHIERFNNTMRQRCSRLVRLALSFSKKLENHIGAIKYFIHHYNTTLALHL